MRLLAARLSLCFLLVIRKKKIFLPKKGRFSGFYSYFCPVV